MTIDDQLEPDLNGTDLQWYTATGMCGGCGMDTCPCGGCTEDLCSRCPSRIREGWFCPPRCDGTHGCGAPTP